MLREIGLSEMNKKGISKEDCVFVARKRGNDELAPPEDLFRDFDKKKQRLERDLGKGSEEAHNKAFLDCDYERRFRNYILGNPKALDKLEEIFQRSHKKDVYLVCYEGLAKACHRRILLRIAEERFGAKVIIDGVEPK
jgi:sugar-specific transcriptional regulator TrmB